MMAAQVSLASSAICSPDTSLHDIPLDTIELQNDETILTGQTPSSSPAGAAPRKDIDVDGGRIHFAGLRPLPALLREWTHGPASGEKDGDNNDDDNNRQKQSSSSPSSPSRDRAQRTSSGTPIAVAVQNDRDQDNIDDLDGTIPPPPPPPRNHNTCNNSNPQASPLWSMLQSSVTAATTTATSGAAASSNAAAVLPAAALDSPPVKAGLAHLDRAIDQHGPVVAKILTNSMCHLRSSIDQIYAIAAPIPDVQQQQQQEGGANDIVRSGGRGQGIELDITENDLMPGGTSIDIDADPAKEEARADEEDEGFVVLDSELLSSFAQSEYDDQDDKFEEELMRKHGRGCIRRRGEFAIGDDDLKGNRHLRGGAIRRVRAWMRRRRERCAEAKRERRPSSGGDDHTVATDVDTHLALDLVRGPPSCAPSTVKGQYHPIADGESSDGGCASQKVVRTRSAKSRKDKAKQKNKKLRGWGRSKAGTDDSAGYQSSSSSDGTCSAKKRKRRRHKKGGKKNDSSKVGAPSPETIPTAPEAQIIYRGASVGPNVKPPAAAEARLIGQYDPLSGRYLRYGDAGHASPSSSLANRPRLHSSPAFFFADAAAEKTARDDNLFGSRNMHKSIMPGAFHSIELLPDKYSQNEAKKAKNKIDDTDKPVDELLRSITSALEEDDDVEFNSNVEESVELMSKALVKSSSPSIEEDWVVVQPPASHQESPVDKSIKAIFLSSLALSDQKSALVDRIAGVHSHPRSSAGIAMRNVPISSGLKLSIYDVSAADHGLASLTFTSETTYVIVYDLGITNPATNIRKCSDACDTEKEIKKANRALQIDIEENLVSFAPLIAQSNVKNCTILPLIILPADSLSKEEELRRLAIMHNVIASNTSNAGISFSQRLLVDGLDEDSIEPITKDIIRAANLTCDTSVRQGDGPYFEQVRHFLMTEKDQGAKIIPVTKIIDNVNLPPSANLNNILRQLASSGIFLHFEGENVGKFIVLDPKWLLSAAATVARRREITQHDDIPSHLPIVTSDGANELWKSMSFISNALADGSVAMTPDSFTSYMKEILVAKRIFIPYETDDTTIYFIPTLCNDMPADDSWSYKTPESWRTTMASSWTFDSSATTTVMNVISSALLSHFSSVFAEVEVTQVMAWRSSFLVHLSPRHAEAVQNGDKGSVTIFGHLASENDSNLSVATSSAAPGTRRFVVSARGQSGGGGRNIWDGGYRSVLSTLNAALSELSGIDQLQETICPDCLASQHPSRAATWSNDSLRRIIASNEAHVLCSNGHRVETALLCGLEPTDSLRAATDEDRMLNRSVSSVNSHLGSVVLVGLYDERRHAVMRVGSGFVADAKRGLVVTAAHVVIDIMSASSGHRRSCKAIIGVLPRCDPSAAVYRYFAELLVEDFRTIDACVLRITTKFEQDVSAIEECGSQPEIPVANNMAMLKAELQPLKMTSAREIGEDIRILGYSQSGALPRGGHINRSPDLSRGYIARIFRADHVSTSSSVGQFVPREEIVCSCRVIEGMSGGPAINNNGKVLGLLSRSDKADGERCYLVPASELRSLVKRAKAMCSLTPLEIYWRMNSTASGESVSTRNDSYM